MTLKEKSMEINSAVHNWHCVLFITFSLFMAPLSTQGKVWTYDVPGGEKLKSQDYEVTLTCEGETVQSFVYLSYEIW